MTCDKCGREIKNYGHLSGGVRCPNHCQFQSINLSEFPMITVQMIQQESRFSANPTFSLFRVSPDGRYHLSCHTKDVNQLVDKYNSESGKSSTRRLEVRIDGTRIDV